MLLGLQTSVSSSAASVTGQEPLLSTSSSHRSTIETTVTQPNGYPFKQPSGYVQSSQRPFNRLHPSGGVGSFRRPLNKPLSGGVLSLQHSNKPHASPLALTSMKNETGTPTESKQMPKHRLGSTEEKRENCSPKKFLWDQTIQESRNKEPNCKTQ